MMGGRLAMQESLFYAFRLEDHVPSDQFLRRIDRFVDCSELRQHLAGFYSATGRPSVDPELMIRMLLIGYCLGIRSERRLCERGHLNLAYHWFCRLGLDGKVPDHSTFSKNRHGRFRECDWSVICSRQWCSAPWLDPTGEPRITRRKPHALCANISLHSTRPPGVQRQRLSRSLSHPLIRRLSGPVHCEGQPSLPMPIITSLTSRPP